MERVTPTRGRGRGGRGRGSLAKLSRDAPSEELIDEEGGGRPSRRSSRGSRGRGGRGRGAGRRSSVSRASADTSPEGSRDPYGASSMEVDGDSMNNSEAEEEPDEESEPDAGAYDSPDDESESPEISDMEDSD